MIVDRFTGTVSGRGGSEAGTVTGIELGRGSSLAGKVVNSGLEIAGE